jgi:hypothetical protein
MNGLEKEHGATERWLATTLKIIKKEGPTGWYHK